MTGSSALGNVDQCGNSDRVNAELRLWLVPARGAEGSPAVRRGTLRFNVNA